MASQLKLVEFVQENKRFDSGLLAAFAEITGGAEFVTACHGTLSVPEFADLLQAIDSATVRRLLATLEVTQAAYAAELKTELALADVKVMPDDSLRLETEKCSGIGHTLIVRLIGYLDNYNADLFESKLESLVSAGYRFLVLDCGKLSYISSAGLGALVKLLQGLARQDGTLCLCRLDKRIWEVFACLGINRFFMKADTIQQGLELCTQATATPPALSLTEPASDPLLPPKDGGDSQLEIAGLCRLGQEAAGSYYDYKPLAGHRSAAAAARPAPGMARRGVDSLAAAERRFRAETAPSEDLMILSVAFV